MPRDKRKDKYQSKARRKIRKNQLMEKARRMHSPEPYVVAAKKTTTAEVVYLSDIKDALFERILDFSEEECEIIQREVSPFMSLVFLPVKKFYTINNCDQCVKFNQKGRAIYLGTQRAQCISFTDINNFEFDVGEIIYYAYQFDGGCYGCWDFHPRRYNEKFIAFRGSELFIIYSIFGRKANNEFQVEIVIRKQHDWQTGISKIMEAKKEFEQLWHVLEDLPAIQSFMKKAPVCY